MPAPACQYSIEAAIIGIAADFDARVTRRSSATDHSGQRPLKACSTLITATARPRRFSTADEILPAAPLCHFVTAMSDDSL